MYKKNNSSLAAENIVDIRQHKPKSPLDYVFNGAYKYWPMSDGFRYFVCDKNGSRIITTEEDGNGNQRKPIIISNTPFYPETFYTTQSKSSNADKHYVALKIQNFAGEWVTETVSIDAINDGNKKMLNVLSNLGFEIRQSRGICKYLTELIRPGIESGCIAQTEAYEQAGWNADKTEYISPDHPAYVGEIKNITSTTGSEEDYLAFVETVIQKHPMAGVMLSAAAGGFLRGSITNMESSFVHLVGASSTGKTLMLKFCNSVAGYDMTSWSSTKASLETLLEAHSSAFLSLDEASGLFEGQNQRQNSVVDFLMHLANGGGRNKKSINGTNAKAAAWGTTLLSTGNQSIVAAAQGTNQAEALKARVLEITVNSNENIWNFENSQEANFTEEFLAENKGHLLSYIVRAAADPVVFDKAQTVFDALCASFDDSIEGANVLKRQGRILALMGAGAEILEAIFGSEALAPTKAKIASIHKSKIYEAQEVKSDNLSDWMSNLMSFLQLNKKHVGYKGYKYHEVAELQREQAKVSFEAAEDEGLFIVVQQKEEMADRYAFTGKIIVRAASSSSAKVKGFETLDGLISTAYELGFLELDPKRPTAMTKTHKSMNAKCYVFDMAIYNELVLAESAESENREQEEFDRMFSELDMTASTEYDGEDCPF